jgi:hypothetical protein
MSHGIDVDNQVLTLRRLAKAPLAELALARSNCQAFCSRSRAAKNSRRAFPPAA